MTNLEHAMKILGSLVDERDRYRNMNADGAFYHTLTGSVFSLVDVLMSMTEEELKSVVTILERIYQPFKILKEQGTII